VPCRAGAAFPTGTRCRRPCTVCRSHDGATVVRDDRGNALGGLRLAPFDVPTALDAGTNENPPGGAGLCFLNGTHIPFDRATLQALYPDRQTYLEQFTRAVWRNVRDGYVMPADAWEMLRDARHSLAGRDLECGLLCADVAQFPIHPSTQLLRDHTAFLYMRGGDELLDTLDEATLAVARGQTQAAGRDRYTAEAIRLLDHYRAQLARQYRLGRATADQERLLDGYAALLIERLDAAS
jgi:hypothetical protein